MVEHFHRALKAASWQEKNIGFIPFCFYFWVFEYLVLGISNEKKWLSSFTGISRAVILYKCLLVSNYLSELTRNLYPIFENK